MSWRLTLFLKKFNMKVNLFYDELRVKNVDNLTIKKLINIDDEILAVFKNLQKKSYKRAVTYIYNNKLSLYYLYHYEKWNLDNLIIYKDVLKKAIYKWHKMLDTIEYLNKLWKKIDEKFYFIKTLNLIPYLPVYDIDLFHENSWFINKFEQAQDQYEFSKEEKEVNKFNFLSKNNILMKLSFHTDITWDWVKNFSINEYCKDSYFLSDHISLNTLSFEAIIKLQEWYLEKLYFNIIEFIFIKYFLEEKYRESVHFLFNLELKNDWKKFPYFVRMKDISKSKDDNFTHLLFKNFKRYLIWRWYYILTSKVPFHE